MIAIAHNQNELKTIKHVPPLSDTAAFFEIFERNEVKLIQQTSCAHAGQCGVLKPEMTVRKIMANGALQNLLAERGRAGRGSERAAKKERSDPETLAATTEFILRSFDRHRRVYCLRSPFMIVLG